MNFSGVSLHSPEIGVCQPKVYGDIHGIPFMIKIIKIANQDRFDYHCQWRAFCHSYSIPSSTIQFSHKFKSMPAAECNCFHFSCHHLEAVSFLSQQSKQSGFGDDLV